MSRCATTLLLPLVIAACGGPAAPAIPTPIAPTPPAPENLILRGFVHDTAFRPVADVTVEIIDGPHAGTSMTTSPLGRFEFTGAFVRGSLFTLRATRQGYAATTRSFTIPTGARPEVSVSLPLNSLAAPVDISGAYSLTLTADSACVGLPEAVRTRTYEVEIVPLSPPTSLKGGVLGTAFLDGYNWFSVGVAGDYVSFIVDFDGPTIVERVAERSLLAIGGGGGVAVGMSKPSEITLPFDGEFFYCELKPESSGPPYSACFRPDSTIVRSSCMSRAHRLTLTRH
jgi:carboxypeptidase family protein